MIVAALMAAAMVAWLASVGTARGADLESTSSTIADTQMRRVDITLDPTGLPEADRIASKDRMRAIADALDSNLPLFVSFDPRETLKETLAILAEHGVETGPSATLNFDTMSVWMPADAKPEIAKLPFIKTLRKPVAPISAGVFDSEGIEATGADLAHLGASAPTVTGDGISVAIIDRDYESLDAVIANLDDELGAIPTTDMWFETSQNNFNNISVNGQGDREHGTASAEVIYEMAPGATIVLYKVREVAELGFAVRHAADQGYDVIHIPLTHIQTMSDPVAVLSGGTNIFTDDIDYAVAAGSIVVVAAGNEGKRHVADEYLPCAECDDGHAQYICNDASNDTEYHKFVDEFTEQPLLALTWDDDHYDAETFDLTCWSAIEAGFDATKFKYRLHRYDDGSEHDEPICPGDSGVTNISGTEKNLGEPFTKSVSVFDGEFDEYLHYISLRYTQPGSPLAQWPDFRIACGTGVEEFLFITTPGSLSDLAVVPNAITVSEVDAFFEDEITETSSQGPAASGQKPDVGGPGIVENFTVTEFDFISDWTFNGTSAASAHVAAMAALLQEYRLDNAMPVLTQAQMKHWLQSAALDIEDVWIDDKVGHGFVQVPKVIYEGEVGPLDFYPITPCRLVDTRFDTPIGGGAPSQMQATVERVFVVSGAGSACGIPADAQAISGTVSAVAPAAAGFITLFPADELLPAVSSVNFGVGGVTNNNLFLKLSASGTVRAYTPTGPNDMILDVNGYFR